MRERGRGVGVTDWRRRQREGEDGEGGSKEGRRKQINERGGRGVARDSKILAIVGSCVGVHVRLYVYLHIYVTWLTRG